MGQVQCLPEGAQPLYQAWLQKNSAIFSESEDPRLLPENQKLLPAALPVSDSQKGQWFISIGSVDRENYTELTVTDTQTDEENDEDEIDFDAVFAPEPPPLTMADINNIFKEYTGTMRAPSMRYDRPSPPLYPVLDAAKKEPERERFFSLKRALIMEHVWFIMPTQYTSSPESIYNHLEEEMHRLYDASGRPYFVFITTTAGDPSFQRDPLVAVATTEADPPPIVTPREKKPIKWWQAYEIIQILLNADRQLLDRYDSIAFPIIPKEWSRPQFDRDNAPLYARPLPVEPDYAAYRRRFPLHMLIRHCPDSMDPYIAYLLDRVGIRVFPHSITRVTTIQGHTVPAVGFPSLEDMAMALTLNGLLLNVSHVTRHIDNLCGVIATHTKQADPSFILPLSSNEWLFQWVKPDFLSSRPPSVPELPTCSLDQLDVIREMIKKDMRARQQEQMALMMKRKEEEDLARKEQENEAEEMRRKLEEETRRLEEEDQRIRMAHEQKRREAMLAEQAARKAEQEVRDAARAATRAKAEAQAASMQQAAQEHAGSETVARFTVDTDPREVIQKVLAQREPSHSSYREASFKLDDLPPPVTCYNFNQKLPGYAFSRPCRSWSVIAYMDTNECNGTYRNNLAAAFSKATDGRSNASEARRAKAEAWSLIITRLNHSFKTGKKREQEDGCMAINLKYRAFKRLMEAGTLLTVDDLTPDDWKFFRTAATGWFASDNQDYEHNGFGEDDVAPMMVQSFGIPGDRGSFRAKTFKTYQDHLDDAVDSAGQSAELKMVFEEQRREMATQWAWRQKFFGGQRAMRKPSVAVAGSSMVRATRGIQRDAPGIEAAAPHAKVAYGRSPIHDWGLFATEPIRQDDPIVEYVGEILEGNVMTEKRDQHYVDLNMSTYLFRVGYHTIDATERGNYARFINHCCDPNCVASSNTATRTIYIKAKRDIEPGEEITYDYKLPYVSAKERVRCHCGARNCRMFINFREENDD
ncbi:SET domain [Carpediemonas membranifera]|uniref:[histone H3]-lysine(4) N-trimethyltransferase n=1 Tax=Carpediemonas membranifera TaxID=201153 RepID=A0A8J6E0C6_9EUKA|nr:SET domain [Carpediemonas membranifera]|eukprot:KAG9391646.1 SET domain [Carpediemonas membranifera]